MKLVFAGTPDFAAAALAALIAAGHEIVLALSQPDRPAGRGLQVHPTPVKALAARHGIDVIQPLGLRIGGKYDADARLAHDRLGSTPHDAMIVAAYGLILPPALLAIARLGCINIHASLLPRWRGAAPIQRAIEAGDRETGITIMQMDAGLDTGAMLLIRRIAIAADDTAATMTDKLAALGGAAVVEALPLIEAGVLEPLPQHDAGDASAVTYAAKLSKAEAPLDFGLTSRALVDRIRAFDPWPGCSAELDRGAGFAPSPFKIWGAASVPAVMLPERSAADRPAPGQVLAFREGDAKAGAAQAGGAVVVATADGAVALTELQKPGGKRLPARSFARDFGGSATLRFVKTPLP